MRLFYSAATLITAAAAFFTATSDCAQGQTPEVYPLSDPNNEGGWIYNAEVSDEFDDAEIDEDRWYIVGKFENGRPVYIHPDLPQKKVWKGRAPSQFSGRNYSLEDGLLKLEARWEPDFPFTKEIHKPVFGDALPYENITTPCFISRKPFKYGYVEIKSKAADAEVTSAFWSMGPQLEFDFFEQFGDGRNKGKDHLDSELWWSIRDWGKLKGKPSYTERKDLGFRVADDFHVYGVDWDETGVRYYVDGKLFTSVTADEARAWAKENRDVDDDYDGWVATKPINIWLDMETFPWHGVPDSKEDLEANSPEGEKDDGVVTYDIEYVRVWQKPGSDNSEAVAGGSEGDFFGFEGPIEVGGKKEEWWIPQESRNYFSISEDKAKAGQHSLRFTCDGGLGEKAVAFAPFGAAKLSQGKSEFSMEVWVEPNSEIKQLRVILEDPWLALKPFDLSEVPTGEWVTLRRTFQRRTASGPKDRPRILVEPTDVGGPSILYIDEISLGENSQ